MNAQDVDYMAIRLRSMIIDGKTQKRIIPFTSSHHDIYDEQLLSCPQLEKIFSCQHLLLAVNAIS